MICELQVPQFILEDAILSGCGATTSIIVTQPRRIAATSVAERVAAERGEEGPGAPGGVGVEGFGEWKQIYENAQGEISIQFPEALAWVACMHKREFFIQFFGLAWVACARLIAATPVDERLAAKSGRGGLRWGGGQGT